MQSGYSRICPLVQTCGRSAPYSPLVQVQAAHSVTSSGQSYSVNVPPQSQTPAPTTTTKTLSENWASTHENLKLSLRFKLTSSFKLKLSAT